MAARPAAAVNPLEAEATLRTHIASFRHNPLGYVLYNFPWGKPETPLADHAGPRQWQIEELEELGQHLQNGATVHDVYRKAIASGHGSGKSTLIVWIMKWGLDTFPDTKIVCTANTDTQLKTKTWPELAKWHRMSLTQHWFTCTATALVSNAVNHERTWRADAIPWSEHNTEAFQGLHNEGKRIVVVFEEASGIADPVWEVTQGALTDTNTEIIWVAPGNPTQANGYFRECFRRFRHRWSTRHIDSRDVEGTNKELFAEWVKDYGEDSDFVKVRVRGLFPSLSFKGLFAEADVDSAYGRILHPGKFNFAPVILSCDSAWTGGDPLIIGKRQGLHFEILRKIPYNDNDVQIAAILGQLEDEHQADAVNVDMGYGTGIVSAGRTMGRNWTLVNFGSNLVEDEGCLNMRAQMYKRTRDWIKAGAAIPEDQNLRQQMIDIEIVARLDNKLQLESKKEIKKRLGYSPDELDALVLTHAHHVQKKWRGEGTSGSPNFATMDYDPFARLKRGKRR